jgi:hypothetical protein
MKIILKNVLGLFILATIFVSCNSEKEDIAINSIDNEIVTFKSNFPHLSNKISTANIQKVGEVEKNSKSSQASISGITFPIIENEEVIGRYIGLSDESSAIYIDFSDYTNKVTVYNVIDPSVFETFQMIYNPENGNYEPSYFGEKGFWCGASCTIGAIAIAASDGPSPLMDFLAISFQIACLADCAEL